MKTKTTNFCKYIIDKQVLYTNQGFNKKKCKLFLDFVVEQIKVHNRSKFYSRATRYYNGLILNYLSQKTKVMNHDKSKVLRIFKNIASILERVN